MVMSFEAGLRYATTGKLSVNLAVNGYLSVRIREGYTKAAEGDGRAPPFISCVQDTVRLLPSLPLRLLGYGKPLPIYKI